MLTIGIAGGTGSGKTTVVQQIIDQLPEGEVCIISQDSYYKDTSHLNYDERVDINFDHPQAIDFDLLVEHLRELQKGNPVEQPVYSFVEQHRERWKTFSRRCSKSSSMCDRYSPRAGQMGHFRKCFPKRVY